MFSLQYVWVHTFTSTLCSLVCASACASPSQCLFLWLSQAPPALQTLWRWRRWQTAQPSWPGVPAETTAAPSLITSSRPGLPSLWAGRGLTQVGRTRWWIFILYRMWCYSDNSWIPRREILLLLFPLQLGGQSVGSATERRLWRLEGFKVLLERTGGHGCCFYMISFKPL